jgi:hypothetical protein
MVAQPRRWITPLLVALVAATACGESPTGTGLDPDGGAEVVGTESDPLPQGAPALPVPAGPFADVPATSDTLTVIRPFSGAFRPEVDRAFGDWAFWQRLCSPFTGCLSWQPAGTADQSWSDELGSSFSLQPPALRILLVGEDGSPIEAPTASLTRSPQASIDLRWDFAGDGLDEVYIRRDRYWRWIPLSFGVGDYLIVTGTTDATLESTFTAGTSTTETEEFGRSLTLGATVGYGPLSASVSGTLSESYSVSVKISQESSETFKRTVHGANGKQTRFMVWILMERYTFTDSVGEPLIHPSYEFTPHELHRSGAATALQATEFPMS